MSEIDKEMKKMVSNWGMHAVLGALCRECNRLGFPVVFRKLNRVYEWLEGEIKNV